MASVSRPIHPDHRSPDHMDRLSDRQRMLCYAEDWVSAPRRADSGAALGPETQRQVLALLGRGMDEAEIREAALAALAAEEARIIRRHRRQGWIAVAVCVAIALVGAATWQGRGDGHHLQNVLLLGALGLMIAQAIRARGVRVQSRFLRSADARKAVWREAIAALQPRT